MFVRRSARKWTVACMLMLAGALSGCGDDRPPASPVAPTPEPTLATLTIVPASVTLAGPGATMQLALRASMSDGSSRDVTAEAQWVIVDERVLAVSASGLARALQNGGTTLYARWRQQLSSGISVQISPLYGPTYAVTGVVRDTLTGAGVVDAQVSLGFGVFTGFNWAFSDGNGYVDLGRGIGPMALRISKFGYEYGSASADITADTTLDIRLRPNPGPFIERRIVDRFDNPGVDMKRYRIGTRAGGLIDAWVKDAVCDYNDRYSLTLMSGTTVLESDQNAGCHPRVRAVVPNGEAELRLIGRATGGEFTLLYREPR